ncbi:MAG: hypothetical protein PsegKO_35890 [Pseudohongiellaceae bacterium]
MPKIGLYETIITESLNQELKRLDSESVFVNRKELHPAQAGDRLALHLGRVLMNALTSVNDKDRVAVGVSVSFPE